ncbi:glycosyl hydrolase, partial [Bacteroidota bacterium]
NALRFIIISFSLLTTILIANDKDNNSNDPFATSTFSGLKFRSIGPALTSGRISDFAVNHNNNSEYFVAVCSGGIWKTTNSGTTFNPIFDKQNSYSIGCLALDPNNPHIIWAGTGENNSQRSVSYGDGVYKSVDGGKKWKNVGLKRSEHIGKILIDPRNSNVVYIAAQGPLWGSGGDRGLFRTKDGGITWDTLLYISENTGVTDIVFDPRDYNVIYAASYQRRRHVWTLINGGPESAIYKTTDGGKNWTKLKSGLPSGDLGRIGITISPVNPDYLYAIIEAEDEKGGFFRSTNRGASWQKMNKYIARSPQYYMEIVADPITRDRVYSLDTYSKITNDGGKTWGNISLKNRHVDDHALWIDPKDNNHLLIGGDGGIYETWDGCKNWDFKSNLPVTQFYRVSIDNSEPFYYIYGGTQDNNSLGGPSRTLKSDGIHNSDWFVTNGGDGFESAIDPVNPNIIYAQSQYGGLVRYDKQNGESISIKPQESQDEEPYRWNWDSPLIISPHKNTRLYFAANKLFKSEDRGNSWKVISPDLTKQIDRNKLKVMDRVWGVDAISKNASTSQYGNIVSLSESPLLEGLLYVGTDDGVIQMSEDGGGNWRKIEILPDIPELTYVSCIIASLHDTNTVYATFDNHKAADFKPYILKSNDRGLTWTSTVNNLPKDHIIYTIAEDHVNSNLLFIGSEFGVFFTIDGGGKWTQLKGELPTIAIKDITIQKRENDLVLASFGRGFYILDDYTPLRHVTKEILDSTAHIFPIKNALMFHSMRSRYGQGESFYRAPNPPFGATFTYYLKDSFKSRKQLRKEKEKELVKEEKPIPFPAWEELRAEDNEPKSFLLFTISDEEKNIVRRLKKKPSKGINRITWDLRYSSYSPISSASDTGDYNTGEGSTIALPGKYYVTLSKGVDGILTKLTGPVEFNAIVLNNSTLPVKDRKELVEFQKELSDLSKVVNGSIQTVRELVRQLQIIRKAVFQTPSVSTDILEKILTLEGNVKEITHELTGDPTISARNTVQKPSISRRINTAVYGLWRTTSSPTETQKENYRLVRKEIEPIIKKLETLINTDLKDLEEELDKAGAPWTPGRVPKL